jgi:hypothetical protein
MPSDAEILQAIAATEVERLQRLQTLYNSNTAGPIAAPAPTGVLPAQPIGPDFVDGWWTRAKKWPMHPGRIGGSIVPWSIVAHTTDMPPEDWGALIAALQRDRGAGNGATFYIGRTPEDGCLQTCPINRNANHAGGPQHGVYQDKTGKQYHPNLVSVGIETHNAGMLHLIGGLWRFVEDGKIHGAPFAVEDVELDPSVPGRAYHKPTQYQLDTFDALVRALNWAMPPMPDGVVVRSLYERPAAWAAPASARLVGHTDLDARNRSDPWRLMMAHVRQLGAL